MAPRSNGNPQWSADDLKRLDAWEFCRRGGEVTGETPVPSWSRLIGALHPDSLASPSAHSGMVVWSVSGLRAKSGDCHVVIGGQFTAALACLRCGEPFECKLSFSRRLRLCKSDQEADLLETEDDEDAVAASGLVDVTEWLEDELLLSLPMFPAHDVCAAEAAAGGAQVQVDAAVDHLPTGAGKVSESSGTDKPSVHRPFEVLSGLIKKPGKH